MEEYKFIELKIICFLKCNKRIWILAFINFQRKGLLRLFVFWKRWTWIIFEICLLFQNILEHRLIWGHFQRIKNAFGKISYNYEAWVLFLEIGIFPQNNLSSLQFSWLTNSHWLTFILLLQKHMNPFFWLIAFQ